MSALQVVLTLLPPRVPARQAMYYFSLPKLPILLPVLRHNSLKAKRLQRHMNLLQASV